MVDSDWKTLICNVFAMFLLTFLLLFIVQDLSYSVFQNVIMTLKENIKAKTYITINILL